MTDFTLDFDEIFADFIAANQKKWAHDRGSTIGASEVFDCLRKGFFEKRGAEFGFEPDEDYESDWGAMTRGDLIENHHVVPAVRDHMPPGVKVLYAGDDQVTLVLDKNSATPDGLITGLPRGCKLRIKGGSQDITIPNIKSDCVTLEIKSIDPRATLLEERAKHHGQTQVQLGLFHDKTKHRPYYAIILYVDASFLSKMTPFVVEFDRAIYEEAKHRGSAIWEVDDPNEIMPEGRFSGSCEHCRWRNACGTSTVKAIPEYDKDDADPEVVLGMDIKVQHYLQQKEKLKEAERAEKIAKEMIKEYLLQHNRKKLRSEGWSVTWFGSDGRRVLDTKAMEADGIDLEPYYKDGNPFDVLRVTPRLKSTKQD